MAATDMHGRPIRKGDKVIRATDIPVATGTPRSFRVYDVGRKGSRDDGHIRIAVSHWESGDKFVIARRAQR